MEISEAVKADYQQALYWNDRDRLTTLGGKVAVRLAFALRDTLARALMAENKLAYIRTHEEFGREFEQWQAEADRLLRGSNAD